MNLNQIDAIEKNPLAAARKIVQLEEDIELMLVALERIDAESATVYNMRQRYPKK